MDSVIEARSKKKQNIPIRTVGSKIWNRNSISEEIEKRVIDLKKHYQFGTKLTGIDKACKSPYPKEIRHCHVHENRPDPLIFYKIIPSVGNRPAILFLITVSTHDEAFRSKDAFYAFISQHIPESIAYPTIRSLIEIVENAQLSGDF